MISDLQRWLNGVVYDLSGPEGLVHFNSHPVLYTLVGLVLLAGAALLLLAWLNRRARAALYRLRRAGALALARDGRTCLRLAARIRAGVGRISVALRRGIPDRAERRQLLALLRGFVRDDLESVLDQIRSLLALSDRRTAGRLQSQLDRLSHQWNASSEDSSRAALEPEIANLRHRLARLERIEEERRDLLSGLEEAAQAVAALEAELASLHQTRTRSLPRFRRDVGELARTFRDLREAHAELESLR